MHNSMDLPFHLLQKITNGFSEEQKVGHGGYADVYRAVHNGEEIAVKRLRPLQVLLDGRQFDNEFRNLNNVQHQNIVRLVGYCYESRYKNVPHQNMQIWAEQPERILCFEYMQGGSLDKHIRDESCGLDWPTCYKIIRGTCAGLNHLHSAQENPIYHLDIKPANILLDENMMAKIADLGLSRLLATTQTHETGNIIGTHGYMPKEYIDRGEISNKFDVFSLGVVIIKIMAGNSCSSSCYGMPPQQFIEHVTSRYSSHEADILQVKACVEIALRCVEDDRNKRPAIKDIFDELGKLGDEEEDEEEELPRYVESVLSSATGILNRYYRQIEKLLLIGAPKRPGQTSTKISPASSGTTNLLGVHPLELRFPFEPNNRIPCELSLTNKTDFRAVFRVVPICPYRYWKICYHRGRCEDPLQGCECPDGFNKAGFLLPRSTEVITVIMEGQQQPPPDTDNFVVVMLSLKSIGGEINTEDDFLNRVEGRGCEAYMARLTAVVCCPASVTMSHEIISTREFEDLKYIDVHPTEPWILTSHDDGNVSIWNYQTQERVKTVRVTKEASVGCYPVRRNTTSSAYSAKFIARKEWFVAGDGYGYIHVYSFESQEIKKFKAHPQSPVYSLAVHPTRPFLLSSSQDRLIKLWDWDDGWVCTGTFEGHTSGVFQVTFNPKDNFTFASAAASDVKVWTIYSPESRKTFAGQYSVGYYFADSDPQYMITSSRSDYWKAYIWDLNQVRVHTLGEWVTAVACHPALPILVTGSIDGTVRLWNATNYRLEKTVDFMLGTVEDLGFIKTSDFRRLVVGCRGGIAIMEINLPTLIDQQQDNS